MEKVVSIELLTPLQEYDAKAALAAEKAAEKEEEKRRQKIAEWENLSSMGMGAGRSTGGTTAPTASSRQRANFRPGKIDCQE